ncbi:hypothetical protein ON010_g10379 [Phytophthora cinnamomi]|nr:hypothetical protein ON010_g10379 [Phytophthora cinnamomi]
MTRCGNESVFVNDNARANIAELSFTSTEVLHLGALLLEAGHWRDRLGLHGRTFVIVVLVEVGEAGSSVQQLHARAERDAQVAQVAGVHQTQRLDINLLGFEQRCVLAELERRQQAGHDQEALLLLGGLARGPADGELVIPGQVLEADAVHVALEGHEGLALRAALVVAELLDVQRAPRDVQQRALVPEAAGHGGQTQVHVVQVAQHVREDAARHPGLGVHEGVHGGFAAGQDLGEARLAEPGLVRVARERGLIPGAARAEQVAAAPAAVRAAQQRERIRVIGHSSAAVVRIDARKRAAPASRSDPVGAYINLAALRGTRGFTQYGWFECDGEGRLLSRQRGVFRVNCMDNLDRTNVVMSLFARRTVLMALQLYPFNTVGNAKDNSVLDSPYDSFEVVFKNAWADNADYVSRMYAGTGALKTDFTRTGRRTIAGALQDGVNSVTRYYLNNFSDGIRQDSFDLLVGNFTPDKRDESPFTFQQQHSLVNMMLEATLATLAVISVSLSMRPDLPVATRARDGLIATFALFSVTGYLIIKKGKFRSIGRRYVCKPAFSSSGYIRRKMV